MSEKFDAQLKELLNAGVITPDIHRNIREYYESKHPDKSGNRMLLTFGIIGAMLVGLGAILIIAHNWDQLSRTVKVIIAFLPLVGCQAFCAYALFGRQRNDYLSEVAAALLCFAIGTCIALVSQVYNIEGNITSFLFTWTVLYLPVIYVMRSAVASLFSLLLVTYYGVNESYFNYNYNFNWYFILLACVVPAYYLLIKKRPSSNFTIFHHWLIAISLTIMLGSFGRSSEEWLFAGYMNLFTCFYLVGHLSFFMNQKRRSSGYLVIGSLGIIILLLVSSFEFLWKEIHDGLNSRGILSPEFIVSAFLFVAAIGLLFVLHRVEKDHTNRPLEYVFAAYFVLFFLSAAPVIPQILINLLLLAISVLVLRKGLRKDRLDILNYGLLILSTQILCRFFDTEMSFLLRGVLFIIVGAGFFFANYRMLNRRKSRLIAVSKTPNP
ncbi:MAG TPA: DUF2157 domain-containing protein [Flavitalea sp.]|nr:DUF2157 domain-containing protein [Flavitalea sp.]